MAQPSSLVAILAAGSGSRFAGTQHKLAAPLGDHTVLERAIAVALEAAIGPVAIVTGAATFDLPPTVTVLTNPNWERGLATSLQVAIEHARRIGAECLVVGLGDQPLVSPRAWAAVADAKSRIAVATYDGVRGNPVKLDATCWHDMPHTGDEGARVVMRLHPDWVLEVPCTGTAFDVDTVQDLARTRRLLNERSE